MKFKLFILKENGLIQIILAFLEVIHSIVIDYGFMFNSERKHRKKRYKAAIETVP